LSARKGRAKGNFVDRLHKKKRRGKLHKDLGGFESKIKLPKMGTVKIGRIIIPDTGEGQNLVKEKK